MIDRRPDGPDQVAAAQAAGLVGPGSWAVGDLEGIPPPSFTRIDAHAHAFNVEPELFALLERLDVRIANICVIDPSSTDLRDAAGQHRIARAVAAAGGGRAPWVATFDASGWQQRDFAERVIGELDDAFDAGAVGVKIWKAIGMSLRGSDGRYLLPDDPVFDPIFDHIAARGRTLWAHIADTVVAWRPPDPTAPHYGHYVQGADGEAWYPWLDPCKPSWESLMAARDRILERHPRLQVIGCHMGGLTHDLHALARRFDAYPNFTVDTSAEIASLLVWHPSDRVRAFLEAYADRILYGVDASIRAGDPASAVHAWEAEYVRDWKYLSTAGQVMIKGRNVDCLALPDDVLRRIYAANAIGRAPGLAPAG